MKSMEFWGAIIFLLAACALIYFVFFAESTNKSKAPPLTPEERRRRVTLVMNKAGEGDASAQLKLGMAYYKGIGLRKDAEQAYFWLTAGLGADPMRAGVDAFRNVQQQLAKELDPARREAADRRIAEEKGPRFGTAQNDIL